MNLWIDDIIIGVKFCKSQANKFLILNVIYEVTETFDHQSLWMLRRLGQKRPWPELNALNSDFWAVSWMISRQISRNIHIQPWKY